MPNKSVADDNHKYFKYFIYLSLGITIFRLLYINAINLAPQEAYYWNYSRHLALSYFDHPPMLAYMIYIFTHLGGQTEFFVRISCVICFFGLTCLIYLTGRLLFSEKVGFFSAMLSNSVLIFAMGATIATPDTPMVFFWMLSFYSFSKLIFTENKKWWYFWGISAGLALLSKYTAVFIVPSVFLFLIFSKQDRKWLLSKEPYLAVILAILVFSPVIVWNAQNSWASFVFQSYRRSHEIGSLSARHFFGYLGTQMGVVSPLVYLGLIYATIQSGTTGFKWNDRRFLLCFFWSFPMILFFTLVATKYWVKMNWVSAAYLASCISLMALYFQLVENKKRWVRTFGITALTVSLTFTLVAHILPAVKALPIPASLDTVTGWKKLARRVEEERREMREGTLVVGYGYGVPSEIAFYTSPQLETYSNNIVGERGLQFDFWSKPDEFLGKDMILVYGEKEKYKNPEKLKEFFVSVDQAEPLRIYRGKKVLTTFYIFRCYGYEGPGS